MSAPRFEHHREALGIGESRPRLSWKVLTARPAWTQAAYEVESSGFRAETDQTSGRIASSESVLVDWPLTELVSRERRRVRVRVWGAEESDASPWSDWAEVEAGLLHAADWDARFITIGQDDIDDEAVVRLRTEFSVDRLIEVARLYVTAHGLYEVEINGQRVADNVLAPGWTSYRDRLRYQTFDVTRHLRPGGNAIGAMVAEGWFAGRIGFRGGRRHIYGARCGLFGQLEIRYRDGSVATLVTDERWTWAHGPIRSAGLYSGETYDARLEEDGWSEPGHDAGSWAPVAIGSFEVARLCAPTGPPVRRVETIAPVEISQDPDGKTVLDFGQNLVGRLRLRVRGPAGTALTIRHAEVLEAGRLCTRPLRLAAATDRYILRGGDSAEVWEPRFTIHGFRYAEIDGWPGELTPSEVEAVVIHTDMERTGWFACSDPLIEQLHENIVWSMRGNFVDVPTDCPQRDERLGWTGDLQVFAPTAAFLYDCLGTLDSWLQDLTSEQERFGTVPAYVPWIKLTFPATPIAAWGDAAVIVPWVMYQRFGDRRLLERQYPSMTQWVDQIAGLAGPSHRWEVGIQFGDWLDPAAPPDRPGAGRTDPHLVATAYHAFTASVVAEAAAILGHQEDASRYAELAIAVRAAFALEFLSPSGRTVSDSSTAYALALQFGLLGAAASRDHAAARLVDLVREGDHRISTGFVGTPLICDALTETGSIDVAYQLLTQRECPSWLYPVTMGATTVWERWDSLLPDGRVNPGQMTSFNHYAFGAIADWLHRVVAGLAPLQPGYRRMLIAPRPGGGLRGAAASFETPYGRASVSWERSGGMLSVAAALPPGTTGLVRMPAADWEPVEVGSGQHAFQCSFRPPEEDPPRPERFKLHAAVAVDDGD